MDSTTEDCGVDYVFGYGSLVEMTAPLAIGSRIYPAVPGRLHGFRRRWGVAMNNWETSDAEKHFVDPATGLKPHIAVAYLDIEEVPGATVNGLAVPVDPRRLRELDRREVNYRRVVVSEAFRPRLSGTVFTYEGTEPARARATAPTDAHGVFVSGSYVEAVRRAFAALGGEALAEYERTTEPLGFARRDLDLRYPPLSSGGD